MASKQQEHYANLIRELRDQRRTAFTKTQREIRRAQKKVGTDEYRAKWERLGQRRLFDGTQ